MNTETIHILIAACTLIAAGITSFPYRLSYGNTSWLPWWMQPDCKYLERPYEYDYPARNINLLFSVSVVAIGILAMLFILTPDLPDDVPAERWFAALAVLYPAYASCQVLFWRKDYGTASAMPAGLRHSAMERYIRFFWQLQPHLPFT